jgi:hypothetical protein
MDDLELLQAVRLKGRVRPADLAATLDEDEAEVNVKVDELGEAGLILAGKSIRLSPEGKERLAELLAGEHQGIDGEELGRAYAEFRSVNGEFKSLVSEWQLRDGAPNDHTDAAYDTAVVGRLVGIHEAVLPILGSASAQVPRLAAYSTKLSSALDKIQAGDTSWFTRPLVDSYHTVWFELHEELIGAAGLTREAEAEAGHAE